MTKKELQELKLEKPLMDVCIEAHYAEMDMTQRMGDIELDLKEVRAKRKKLRKHLAKVEARYEESYGRKLNYK